LGKKSYVVRNRRHTKSKPIQYGPKLERLLQNIDDVGQASKDEIMEARVQNTTQGRVAIRAGNTFSSATS
jgi:hypothetical protein